MFKNYITTAIRNFWKNKLYAFINIIGLAIGLLVFVFANLFADYETSHDAFFANSDRIYSLRSDINPSANLGVVSINAAYTAIAPMVRQDIPVAEKVAVSQWSELIVHRDDVKFYQSTHMVEPEFLDIFQFDYLYGNPSQGLRDTRSLVLTESTAIKYFGRANVLGETLTVNNDRDMRVTAVIKDVPRNSHLAQNLFDDETLEMIVSRQVSHDIFGTTPEGNWGNLSTSLRTYVLLQEGVEPLAVEGQIQDMLERRGPEDLGDIIAAVGLRPVQEMNLLAWQATGIPAIMILRFLGFLVLLIAGINFINLATAQAMGRAREIGIRKTMGASRSRLAIQFLVESVVITFFALLVAMAVIEYALPGFNSATNKVMSFSYFTDLSMLGFLILTVLSVGLLAGLFPAFLLARLDPSKALQGQMALGKWSLRFRKVLVVVQNAFSIFLIITVFFSYSLSKQIENKELGFNAENTINLVRANRAGVNENLDVLMDELARVEGVTAVTAASQYPYEQSNSQAMYGTTQDRAAGIRISQVYVDFNFFDTFEIPLVAGRQLSEDFAADFIPRDISLDNAGTTNVVITRLAANQLGYNTPEEALNQPLYRLRDNDNVVSHVIVGVIDDVLLQGFHNQLKPQVFIVRPEVFSAVLVKFDPAMQARAEAGVDAAWNRILPDFPILRSTLDAAFDDVFILFSGVSNALLGFALMALGIATFGLFGLSAFMAERRIKEVGVRKTFGASTSKIVRLLVFQFSRPIVWAVLLGWALAFVINSFLFENFAMRPDTGVIIAVYIFGGLFSLVLAWVTVGANAYKAASTNPVNSLHYE